MKIIKQAIGFPFILSFLFFTCAKQQQPPTNDDSILYQDILLKDANPAVQIGSTIEIDESDNNEKYINIVRSEMNTGQSLWYANWGGWEKKDSYDLTTFNKNINWMYSNGISPTVHMLAGQDLFMPDWLTKGTWQPEELDTLLKNMIYTLMDNNNNKDKVDCWNVINELFDGNGLYRTNMVWNQMGWEVDSSGIAGEDKINEKHPVFIRKAFMYCREKTKKKLELRDYNIETNNASNENSRKHKGFYQLVKHMLNTHIPLDAVGIQGHLQVGKTQWRLENNALKETVSKFKGLGLEVYITEMDATIEKQAWNETTAAKQREDYYNYIKQAVEGGASKIYFWGIQDGMDKGWLTNEHPLPWDEKLNRKQAYFGVRQALVETIKH